MLKLWGRLSSINVQKTVWCLDELNMPYGRVDAGGSFGVVDTPEYRRLNPNGLVPTIEEDGFVLWESNAIMRYLARRTPDSGLWPDDLRMRADADRWMDWQATAATPAMRDAFWQLVRTPEPEQDQAVIRRSVGRSADMAAILDVHLSDRPFLVGGAFTLADIAVGTHVHRWLNLPIERPRMPHLEAWYDGLRMRPGARQVVAQALT